MKDWIRSLRNKLKSSMDDLDSEREKEVLQKSSQSKVVSPGSPPKQHMRRGSDKSSGNKK